MCQWLKLDAHFEPTYFIGWKHSLKMQRGQGKQMFDFQRASVACAWWFPMANVLLCPMQLSATPPLLRADQCRLSPHFSSPVGFGECVVLRQASVQRAMLPHGVRSLPEGAHSMLSAGQNERPPLHVSDWRVTCCVSDSSAAVLRPCVYEAARITAPTLWGHGKSPSGASAVCAPIQEEKQTNQRMSDFSNGSSQLWPQAVTFECHGT
jgi:hypothetical protein